MPVELMHATMGLGFVAVWIIIGQFAVNAPGHQAHRRIAGHQAHDSRH